MDAAVINALMDETVKPENNLPTKETGAPPMMTRS